ncbi:hypothetical protein AB0I61_33055 [Polymorphospora rubra]|uniref:hypothetical protein n=1 Tax=Polymorphospora rubra TaxID=338584 RepID=UPI0033F2C451
MSTTIDLGDNDYLQLEPARRALRLNPGVGGAQVELTLKISRARDLSPGVPYRVHALLFVGDGQSLGQRMLCALQAPHLVTPLVRQGDVQLVGFATDEQLRIVEQLRQGGDLWVNLRLSVSSVGLLSDSTRGVTQSTGNLPATGADVTFDRPLLTSRSGDLRFDINAGEWGAQMVAVLAATFVEVLVPLGGGDEHAIAVGRLSKARELLRENKVDEALGQARQALDPVRAWYGTTKLASDARKREAAAQTREGRDLKNRTLEERWAFMIEDLYSTLSGALHDDEVTKEFEYSREDGVALVAATAGMLGRLAKERHLL